MMLVQTKNVSTYSLYLHIDCDYQFTHSVLFHSKSSTTIGQFKDSKSIYYKLNIFHFLYILTSKNNTHSTATDKQGEHHMCAVL